MLPHEDIRFFSRKRTTLPEAVEFLVGLPAEAPQFLVGQDAERRLGPRVASDAGLAGQADPEVEASEIRPVLVELGPAHADDEALAVTARLIHGSPPSTAVA